MGLLSSEKPLYCQHFASVSASLLLQCRKRSRKLMLAHAKPFMLKTWYRDFTRPFPFLSTTRISRSSPAFLTNHLALPPDLLSPGFPDFIAQTSGTSGSSLKSFPRYPVTENVDRPFEGRFCVFSSFRFCGPAVKIVDEHGELQKEVFLTNIASGNMRRRMGIAVKDDEKAMTETRKPFC